MNKEEYLAKLRENLSVFPSDERDNAIAYYREFFEDAGVENEQAVIASLGTPSELAKSILNESGINTDNTYDNRDNTSQSNPVFTPPTMKKAKSYQNDSSRTALIIILIIVTFPIWIGVVSAVFGTLFGLFVAAISIAFAFSVASVALIGVGIAWLFVSPIEALCVLGVGFVMLGITIGFIIPLAKIVLKGFVSAIKGVILFIRNIFDKKEVTC